MIGFFHDTLYQPLYNGLIFLIGVVPGADVGLAVLILTIVVKLILLPLSEKALSTQLAMKRFEPELNNIKNKLKDKKEEQAQAILDFYRSHKINPFSSFLVLLIQMPIIISLYYVFYKGGLPVVNQDLLYSFIKLPSVVDMNFLGLMDIGGKSLLFAILVGVTQFFQMRLSIPALPPREKKDGQPTLKSELARSMNIQMRYVMPIFVAFIAYNISGAVGLYWTTSNIFAIAQEVYLRKKFAPLRADIEKQANFGKADTSTKK
jgi:YidC/Oxa1 family membrane protein insertase